MIARSYSFTAGAMLIQPWRISTAGNPSSHALYVVVHLDDVGPIVSVSASWNSGIA